MANANLSAAKAAKNDEFYTQLSEIRDELNNYTDKFQGKVVICNCDDPAESNFVRYFLMNFNRLGLKELIATGYQTSPVRGKRVKLWSEPYAIRVTDTKAYLVGTQTDLDAKGADYFLEAEKDRISYPLYGNYAVDEKGERVQIDVKEEYVDEKTGKIKKRMVKHDLYYEAGDFRSDMCIELLQQADIVVTNPPFSLFREYVAQLMQYEKQFLIIGNMNAITYKEFFPLLKDNKVWIGPSISSGDRPFNVPDDYPLKAAGCGIDETGRKFIRVKGVRWFTNLDHWKRHQMLPLDLGFTYYGHEDMYPKYDNYDAININKVSDIPCDYEPCWYKCPQSQNCAYAQSEGKVDQALCEKACNGQMGVPITFLDKHCPEQFDIVGADFDLAAKIDLPDGSVGSGRFYVKNSRTAEQQNSRTAEQQNSRTAEQQNSRTAEQQNSRIPEIVQSNCRLQEENVMVLWECQSRSLTNIVRNNSSSLELQTQHDGLDGNVTPSSMVEKSIIGYSFGKCNGVMGVPITFLDKYCPEQFEIIKFRHGDDGKDLCVNGKCPYFRILIRRK